MKEGFLFYHPYGHMEDQIWISCWDASSDNKGGERKEIMWNESAIFSFFSLQTEVLTEILMAMAQFEFQQI
jgi:hypothetical protein